MRFTGHGQRETQRQREREALWVKKKESREVLTLSYCCLIECNV